MHWRKLFPSPYLHVGHLDGKDSARVEIADPPCRTDEVFVQQEKKKAKKPVLQFTTGKLGLLLSKTQAAQIAEVTGKDQVEDWAGKTIELYVDTITAFGSRMQVLRIRKPKGKAQLAGDLGGEHDGPEVEAEVDAEVDEHDDAEVNGGEEAEF